SARIAPRTAWLPSGDARPPAARNSARTKAGCSEALSLAQSCTWAPSFFSAGTIALVRPPPVCTTTSVTPSGMSPAVSSTTAAGSLPAWSAASKTTTRRSANSDGLSSSTSSGTDTSPARSRDTVGSSPGAAPWPAWRMAAEIARSTSSSSSPRTRCNGAGTLSVLTPVIVPRLRAGPRPGSTGGRHRHVRGRLDHPADHRIVWERLLEGLTDHGLQRHRRRAVDRDERAEHIVGLVLRRAVGGGGDREAGTDGRRVDHRRPLVGPAPLAALGARQQGGAPVLHGAVGGHRFGGAH